MDKFNSELENVEKHRTLYNRMREPDRPFSHTVFFKVGGTSDLYGYWKVGNIIDHVLQGIQASCLSESG
jgi:hypothetical protein